MSKYIKKLLSHLRLDTVKIEILFLSKNIAIGQPPPCSVGWVIETQKATCKSKLKLIVFDSPATTSETAKQTNKELRQKLKLC